MRVASLFLVGLIALGHAAIADQEQQQTAKPRIVVMNRTAQTVTVYEVDTMPAALTNGSLADMSERERNDAVAQIVEDLGDNAREVATQTIAEESDLDSRSSSTSNSNAQESDLDSRTASQEACFFYRRWFRPVQWVRPFRTAWNWCYRRYIYNPWSCGNQFVSRHYNYRTNYFGTFNNFAIGAYWG